MPARGLEIGQAWRAYAPASLEEKGLSSALSLIHEVDDVRTRLATAFELAGWLLLEDGPPQDVGARSQSPGNCPNFSPTSHARGGR